MTKNSGFSVLLLRIAATVTLLELFGHVALFLRYAPTHGPEEIAVITAMKAHRFSFGGFVHSYWEMYFGYGLFLACSLVVESGLLWQAAGLLRAEAVRVRPMVGLLLLGEIGSAALVWKYFFLIPIITHTFVATCLAVVFFSLRNGSTRAQVSWPSRFRTAPQ